MARRGLLVPVHHPLAFSRHAAISSFRSPVSQGMSWAFSKAAGQSDPPDWTSFPGLERAWPHRIQLDLNEGEVLYIPACCAHEISGLQPASPNHSATPSHAGGQVPATGHVLSVNRFWKTDPHLVHPHLPADALESYERHLAFYE
jgi:hypothetical protein